MRIGVHKLGFESHYYSNSIFDPYDKNGMFTEVNLLISAFKENGYDAEYVHSEFINLIGLIPYDIIFVFNGIENSTSNLKNLKKISKELNYLLTDSRFYEHQNSEYIDNYFVQSIFKMYDKPTYNSRLHLLPIYERKFLNNVLVKKNDRVIFGGSIRERRHEVEEYIYNDYTDCFLNDKKTGTDTRLPILEYKKLLKEYSYGIVLINKKDTEIGNITWRYFEYIANNVLTFVDRKSDPRNIILPKDDFMFVSSSDEMEYKMYLLNNNVELRKEILNKQNERITQDAMSGKVIVDCLIGRRRENVVG